MKSRGTLTSSSGTPSPIRAIRTKSKCSEGKGSPSNLRLNEIMTRSNFGPNVQISVYPLDSPCDVFVGVKVLKLGLDVLDIKADKCAGLIKTINEGSYYQTV